MTQIPIALQLYSVREDCQKDLPGVLQAVAKMGYQGVEFAGYYGRTAQELPQMLRHAYGHPDAARRRSAGNR
jgi:sugar phosphate isomerase/epimerase